MANNNAPFGFSQCATLNGPVNFRISTRKIAAGNNTPIFQGDAVVPVTGTATGYIARATAGAVALAGVFLSCSYQSLAQKKTVYSNYWPGSDAAGDVSALVVDDPMATFLVQAGPVNIGAGKIGQNAQLNVGAGSTATGYSGMFIDTVGITATFPFIIVDVPGLPVNADPTLAYNDLIVGFNNMIYKSGIGGIA